MTTESNNKVNAKIRRLQRANETQECAKFMANFEPWLTLQRTYDDSIKILNHPLKEVYLAVVEDEIVGFIILQMTGSFVGYIQTICIKPDWRNRGIGTRLLKFAEYRIFRETPNVFMCVSSFNEGAQRLYKRLGYEVVGELKDYIVSGHSEILLRKTIAPLTEFNGKRC